MVKMNKSVKNKEKLVSQILWAIAILGLVLTLIFYGKDLFFSKNTTEISQAEQKLILSQTPSVSKAITPTPSPKIVPTVKALSKQEIQEIMNRYTHIYKISMKLKEKYNIYIPSVLEYLNINSNNGEGEVYVDARANQRREDPVQNYYLITKKQLPIGLAIDISEGSGEIIEENSVLFPYIRNNKYCEQDSDCTRNMGLGCDAGSYNFMIPMLGPSGCEGVFLGNVATQSEVEALKCNREQGFVPDVTFTTKCMNNTCTAQDVKLYCREFNK